MDWSNVMAPAFGAASFGFGYLMNRWITGARKREQLERDLHLSAILKNLKDSDIPPETFSSLRSFLTGRHQIASNVSAHSSDKLIDTQFASQSNSTSLGERGEALPAKLPPSNENIRGERGTGGLTEATYEPPAYWTQAAMNRRSYADVQVADAEMNKLIAELESYLNASEAAAFNEAQAAWKLYRSKQIIFAGSTCEGGTIQPLIYNTEAAALTRNRISYLQNDIEARRKM